MTPEELKAMIDGLQVEIKSLNEKKEADAKTATELKATQEEIDTLKTKLKAMEDEMAAEDEEAKKSDKRIEDLEKKMNRPNFSNSVQTKTIGALFADSKEYQEVKSLGSVNSRPFYIKAITDGAGSGEALTTQYRNTDIYANPERPIFISDLIKRVPVADSAVEVMRENVFTNSSAMQAGQLLAKAESNITFSQETYVVQTLAHWIAASKQILADAARLAAYIDNRMGYGLKLKLDTQILYGDGLNQNFKGLFVDANVSNVGQFPVGTTVTGALMINKIRSAITQCQLMEYYNVNGIVLNPEDWQTIETATGTDGHYIWASVSGGAESRIWKVPVIVSGAVTKGDFILGDWTMGATLYDREQMSIRTSESHADYFVKNGIAILAEERAAFAIELPKAFCKGKFTVAAL